MANFKMKKAQVSKLWGTIHDVLHGLRICGGKAQLLVYYPYIISRMPFMYVQMLLFACITNWLYGVAQMFWGTGVKKRVLSIPWVMRTKQEKYAVRLQNFMSSRQVNVIETFGKIFPVMNSDLRSDSDEPTNSQKIIHLTFRAD